MELDAAAGPGRAASLVAVSMLLLAKRRNRPRKLERPKRIPKAPRPSRGGLGDLKPTRSWTQELRVESLEVYEGRGHTIARHVNHAPNADVERLEREREIPASGSFTNIETAQRGLNAAVAAHADAIRNWLGQGGARGTFVRDFTTDAQIGSVLTRTEFNRARARHEEPQLAPASTIRIVLRKATDFPSGFYVVTAYPIPDRSSRPLTSYGILPLADYEGLGHTVTRHVEIAPSELAERLLAEPAVSATSRFADLETAQRSVERAITARSAEIADWLETDGRRLPFTGDATLDEVVGVVLTRDAMERGRRQPQPANRVHFVLIKSADHEAGFYVKTAYPTLPW